jgi:hypothetical protein
MGEMRIGSVNHREEAPFKLDNEGSLLEKLPQARIDLWSLA